MAHFIMFCRKHLDDAVKDSEKEKLHRIQAIKAYETVGDGFDKIVAEYGKLKEELENKQWALAEFDRSKGVPVEKSNGKSWC